MRLTIPALVIACLLAAVTAHARGWEIGPRLAISVPTGDAEISNDLGINAGVAATSMGDRAIGVGLDVAYHRWPGSSYANAELDELFSRLSGTAITGTKLTLSAFQFGGHVKVVPPARGAAALWFKAGAGLYRLNSDLRLPVEQLAAAGWQIVSDGGGSITHSLGVVGSVGIDIETLASMKLGLDVSFHYLEWTADTGAHFTAFTIGISLLR